MIFGRIGPAGHWWGVATATTPTPDLVRRAQRGDVEAFGVLYDRTIRLVRAVAADAGPGRADDAAHDAYLRAFRSLGTLRDPERFAPWLVGIARLVAREHRRARRVGPLVADVAADPIDPGADPDDVAELLRAVDRLPDEERLAIRFFFLNERGIDETARLLGRSRSGTYALLQAARARLARWLADCGVNAP